MQTPTCFMVFNLTACRETQLVVATIQLPHLPWSTTMSTACTAHDLQKNIIMLRVPREVWMH